MPYYVLLRGEWELYAMNMTLSKDEAKRYGNEGETVTVTAIFVWTNPEPLMAFQQFLVATQHDANSPFRGLIEDMRADRVEALELSAGQLRDRLRRYVSSDVSPDFVAIDPGPEQRVRKIEEFLTEIAS